VHGRHAVRAARAQGRRRRWRAGPAFGLGQEVGCQPTKRFFPFLNFLSFPNHFKSKFFGTFPTSFKVWSKK
jgi:hypothetical protein